MFSCSMSGGSKQWLSGIPGKTVSPTFTIRIYIHIYIHTTRTNCVYTYIYIYTKTIHNIFHDTMTIVL